HNLVRLALVSGQDAWRAQAEKLFDGVLPLAADNLFMHLALFNALDLRLRAAEIVVAGQGRDAAALVDAALRRHALDRIVRRARSAGALPAKRPAQEKSKAVAEAAAFICVGERCSLPVTEPARIGERVKAMQEHSS